MSRVDHDGRDAREAGALFLEEPGDITRYVQVFDYLRAPALSPQATSDMLRAATEELT